MRLLLDTNILIPIARVRLADLSRSTLRAISDPGNVLFASIASLWEIAIKARIGKLDIKLDPSELPAHLTGYGIDLVVIEAAHVLAELEPRPDIEDLFDRLLLAQCQVENMRLVTVDRSLEGHPLVWRER